MRQANICFRREFLSPSLLVIFTQNIVHLELNRRKSTGGILKRSREKSLSWNEEELIHSYTDNNYLRKRMPDPKFHEKKDMYDHRDQLVSINDLTITICGTHFE